MIFCSRTADPHLNSTMKKEEIEATANAIFTKFMPNSLVIDMQVEYRQHLRYHLRRKCKGPAR